MKGHRGTPRKGVKVRKGRRNVQSGRARGRAMDKGGDSYR